MSIVWKGRDQRRAPRVDVLLRVEGELVPVGFQIAVCNLSRTGFALISEREFNSGEQLDFRLTAANGPSLRVTAEAVHTKPMPKSGQFVTGFKFVPGRLTGMVPEAAIDRLIDAVSPVGAFF